MKFHLKMEYFIIHKISFHIIQILLFNPTKHPNFICIITYSLFLLSLLKKYYIDNKII